MVGTLEGEQTAAWWIKVKGRNILRPLIVVRGHQEATQLDLPLKY